MTNTTTLPAGMDVCIGYKAEEHLVPAELLVPASGWLCPSCNGRLNDEIHDDRMAAMSGPRTCIAGGHAAGSRYYDCLACYGD
jgi:hypothetical protein